MILLLSLARGVCGGIQNVWSMFSSLGSCFVLFHLSLCFFPFYISLSIRVSPCGLEGDIYKKLYMHICDRSELIDLHKYVLFPKIP